MRSVGHVEKRGYAGDAVRLLGLAALVIAVVLICGRPLVPAQILAAVTIIILVVHAVLGLGRQRAAVFVALCLSVSFAMENLGAATGFPYGAYTFRVGADLPHVGAIPIIVGPLYFGMGYPAWVMACLILGRPAMQPDDHFSLFALPVVAAFAMVQWDVVMDPPNATLWQAWVWHEGGGFFGVPLSNFLGWFLTVWLYFQLFALAAVKMAPANVARGRTFWLLPILLYLASGLCHIPPWLTDADSVLTDGGGRVWSAQALREGTVIAMLFTMLPTAALALLRLYDSHAASARGVADPVRQTLRSMGQPPGSP